MGLHCGEIAEQFDRVLGQVVNSTARLTGMARIDQILASHRLANKLPSHCLIYVSPLGGAMINTNASTGSPLVLILPVIVVKLLTICACAIAAKHFSLTTKPHALSAGRDPACKLLIQDRKAL